MMGILFKMLCIMPFAPPPPPQEYPCKDYKSGIVEIMALYKPRKILTYLEFEAE